MPNLSTLISLHVTTCVANYTRHGGWWIILAKWMYDARRNLGCRKDWFWNGNQKRILMAEQFVCTIIMERKDFFLKIFVINPCTKVLKSLHNLFGSFPLLLIWILKFHIRALQLLKLAAVDRNKIYPMLIHFDFHNRLQEWKLNCSYNVMFVNNKVNQIVKCFDAIWVADFFYWMMPFHKLLLKLWNEGF